MKIPPPLVLVEGMNITGDYMEKNSPWDPNTKIKDFYHRAIPLFERRLPQGNSLTITYPFITTDDFLEDILLEMPFKLNTSKFYTGFQGDFKYLLPVKKEYFNFFKISDLKNNLSIAINDGQVKVTLKVPLRNRKGVSDIVFTKKYEKSKGSIIECRTGLGIYPFYQVNDPDTNLQALNDYTVLLAERNEKIRLHSLEFFSFRDFASDVSHITAKMTERSVLADINSGDSTAASKYYRVGQAFDYMELSYTDVADRKCTGLIIPDFEKRTFNKDNLNKAFTFAIDFGTSNTHIAYKENNLLKLMNPTSKWFYSMLLEKTRTWE